MAADRRRSGALLALVAALVVLLTAVPAYAQLFQPEPPTSSPPPSEPQPEPQPETGPEPEPQPEPEQPDPLVPAPSEPPPPAPPPEGQQPPPDGADQAPPEGGGDGQAPAGGPRRVPPEAQAIIDSIKRSPANNSKALYAAVQELVELGLTEQEAIRIGFGRFPVAGVANFVHDWYFPRWGPGFRFHLGTDVFADYGTPLRSPVDGTATAGSGALGGLYVKIFQPDGSYFYLAHMSGLLEGFENGMQVRTGDIVGYVGNSGNARSTPPHVHLGVYTAAGEATDPKPLLDQMLADAQAALPGIIEQVRARRPVVEPAAPPAPRVPRSLLASSLLRPVIDGRSVAGLDAAVLLEAVGNPSSGGLAVAEAEAGRVAASIDWEARAERGVDQRQLLQRAGERFRLSLGALATAAPRS